MDGREQKALELAQAGAGRVVIARETGLSEHRIRKIQREATAGEVLAAAPVPTPCRVQPVGSPIPEKTYYEDATKALCAMIGQRALTFKPSDKTPNEGYALFSDIHFPFHDPEMLVAACDKAESLGLNEALLAGDTFDYYRLSSYAKSKRIHLEDEFAKARVGIEYLCSRFASVRIWWGNHEKGREERNLYGLIPEEYRFLVPSPTKLLTAGISNLSEVGHVTPWGKEMVWLYQLGDAVLTHCEKSASAQGLNVEKLKQWIFEWGNVIGVSRTPRLITAGHTHRLTQMFDDDCMLVESGMLAGWDAQDYQVGPAIGNRKPGVHGFVAIYQENGRTDHTESRVIKLRA